MSLSDLFRPTERIGPNNEANIAKLFTAIRRDKDGRMDKAQYSEHIKVIRAFTNKDGWRQRHFT